jgi:voltage-gated potassium channel
VEQYLRTRGVEPSVTREVRDYYDYVWDRFRGLDERRFLRDLPSPMRLEIYMQLARELIEKVPLFQLCSGPLRNEILLALDPQIVPPGHFLVREGEAGQGIFFISGGRAEILRGDPAVVCGELQAGDHFGELSLLLGERRSASVRAITHCDVFVLDRGCFNEIKAAYPELRDVMSRVAEERSEKMAALVIEGVTL